MGRAAANPHWDGSMNFSLRYFSGSPSRQKALFSIAIALAVFATFGHTLGYGFIWDDISFIQHNPFIRDLGNIERIFASGDAEGTGGLNPYYRPITTLSFALDSAIWGSNPLGFHLMNVLLHLGVCLALFSLLAKLASPTAAFVATLLFTVHPANAEPVAYVSARADLLCGLFCLICFNFYLEYNRTESRWAYYVSLGTYILALFSKIIAVAVPITLFLAFYFSAKRWRKAFGPLDPFILCTAAFFVIRGMVLHVTTWGNDPLASRLATAGTLLLEYLRLTFLPFTMRIFYDLPIYEGFTNPAVLGSWIFILTLIAIALFSRLSRNAYTGLFWYFLTLVPVSGFVTFFPLSLIAARYLYVPLIGLALCAALAFDRLRAAKLVERNGLAARAAAAAAIVVIAGYTAYRASDWGSALSFWNRAHADLPNNSTVRLNYGITLSDAGQFEEARKVLSNLRDDGYNTALLNLHLGVIALVTDDLFLARRQFALALSMDPNDARIHAWQGRLMYIMGNKAEAANASQRALELNPWLNMPKNTLAMLN